MSSSFYRAGLCLVFHFFFVSKHLSFLEKPFITHDYQSFIQQPLVDEKRGIHFLKSENIQTFQDDQKTI